VEANEPPEEETRKMSDYRLWETTLKNWVEVARELESDQTCDEVVQLIREDETKFLPNDLLAVRVPLDDCARVREVVEDLGLSDEFEDVTE
jgi:hypothetical protein